MSPSPGERKPNQPRKESRVSPAEQATTSSELVLFSAMEITKRLRLLLEHRGVPPERHTRVLADAAGVSLPAVRNWFSGDIGNIRNENLIAIAKEFKTTTDWLLMGKGLMNDPTVPIIRFEGGDQAGKKQKRSEEKILIHIQKFDLSNCVDTKSRWLDSDPVSFEGVIVTPEWLKKKCSFYTSIDNLAIVSAFDESMTPTFTSGDALLIDRGITSVERDGLYLFVFNQKIYIKRLQLLPDNNIRVISDNRLYHYFDVIENEQYRLEIKGRIVLILGVGEV
ncbi:MULTISPECIES: XRE family transcriptional regulator [unclassified Pseudomonas]|uniref:XRE family transcriptional regulator n=1 Tax=unclassified Pseudomonas TaxID=196821 RepID=UPI001C60A1B0|nr:MULTISPECIES: XRE family transcriptional regulator [unclassified Pseudomonas]MBW5416066.1 helix-turn-helix domain-containing protein [Pseudomonas sp. MAG002Y]